MQRLQLGVVVSSFERQKVKRAVVELKKSIKGVKAEYYVSRLPFSTTLFLPKPLKKDAKNFNHVIVKLNGKKIIELFGTRFRANGRLYDENIPKTKVEKVIKTLAKNEIYTFKALKKYHYEIKYLMMLVSFTLLFLSSNLVLLVNDVTAKVLGLVIALFSVVTLMLYSEE